MSTEDFKNSMFVHNPDLYRVMYDPQPEDYEVTEWIRPDEDELAEIMKDLKEVTFS